MALTYVKASGIDSTGSYTMGNLTITANLTVANASITGQVGNALLAGTVYTNAQPNITSVGTLTSLTASGNITGNYIIGNGSQLTGLPAGYANSNVAAYLPTYTGNISANYFIGNGSTLTNITGANVDGYVATASAANTAGTVTTNAQPNITSVGTLTSLTASGLITATSGGIKVGNLQDPSGTNTIQLLNSNISVTGNIVAGAGGSGNVTATYFIGNGSQLTGLPASYANTNVAAYLPTYTGNVSANYFIGNGATLTNLTGANVTGYVATATAANTATTAGTVTTAAQPNITSLGTLSSLTTTGNVTVGADLFVGSGASSTSFTNPIGIFKDTGLTYVQVAVVNSTGTGSADITTYGNNGDDTQSWADMGFTGNSFNDTNYTVTSAGDGYFFVQGNTSFGGNMVIATGNLGTTKDIIFATGGFLTGNIKARLYNANGVFSVSNGISTSNLTVSTSANLGANGNITITGGSSGQVLTTNGSGVLTWTTPGGGSTITNDTTTNSNYYPVFTTTTSGTMSNANIATTKLYFNPSTGTLNSTIFNSLSDRNMKTELVQITDALEKVKQLTGYIYTIVDSGERSAGLLSQDVNNVLPEAVRDNNGTQSLNYNATIGLLVESIKILSDKVDNIIKSLE